MGTSSNTEDSQPDHVEGNLKRKDTEDSQLRKTRRKLELLQCSTVNFQNQEILVRQDALDAPGLTASLSYWKDIQEGPLGHMLDVTSLPMGFEIIGGVMIKLIERKTPIIINEVKMFTTCADNQPSVLSQVSERGRVMTNNSDFPDKSHLDGIPPAPHAETHTVFSVPTKSPYMDSASGRCCGVHRLFYIFQSH